VDSPSNSFEILNEIAGKTASKVLTWVVPQLMEAWDDDNVDVNRTLNRIISGVMHHPAQRRMGEDGAEEGRQLMFGSVEQWWSEMDEDAKEEYRRKLSRDGVRNNENHREGVHDTGHGCGKPLGMHKNFANGGSLEDRIAGAAAGAIFEGVTGGISGLVESQTGGQIKLPSGGGGGGSSGGDSFGGGLLGQIGSSLLGGAFKKEETESYEGRRQYDDGSYTESRTEYGRSDDRYGQAAINETRYSGGGERREYSRYEQDESGRGYGYQERTETRPSYGGGYEERTERRYESNEDSYGESSGWSRRDDGGDRYERRDDGDSYGRSDEYGRSDYGREERSEYGRSNDYGRSDDYEGEERHGHRRSDDNDVEERREESGGGGGGGFLGRIIDQVGEELDEGRRGRDDRGWGF